MIDLTGRAAVVLGAGTGVGQAAALTLARLGAGVAALDRDPLAVAGTALLAEPRGSVRDHEVDTTDPAAVGGIRELVEAGAGVPHVVVEATAGLDPATATAVVRPFLDGMIRRGRGGRIVLVGSSPPAPGAAAATAELARELARYGILVNGVCAGPMETEAQPARARLALEREIPLRRLAHPEEVAAAVAFFASDQASFITGEVLSVSGGLAVAR